ncbi:LysM peptidoglycan-binding domain-containing protein [Pontibacter vulgaris]|uniref:LysM peptidoglycan-binding domain-containing protein n=1 Tax=Pontibacter vulgaris TaxID=2905679 RepID=UPI001FA6C00F|nr:LysM peptidoglycan-binding domain-containing protein [Pontibacter vulgaris]
MRKSLPLLLLFLLPFLTFAQNVVVPKNVYFAGIHLTISDSGQQEIQKKVDALHRNQTYFKIKVDLADTYFPLIERVLTEEGVPDDFKYLSLQESGLVPDAVSTSNAVGFWQFKKEAASDFNLRINTMVDERRHILEATRGAAKYFKRSNNYYDNWLNTLLSYLEGYTGAKAYTKPSDKGAKKMEITDKTHPYVLTFLAHKIAYDNFVGKMTPPALALREHRAAPGQSLADIALASQTDPAELAKYNKWLLGSSIPSDKDYYVMIPVRNSDNSGLLASNQTKTSPAPVGSKQVVESAAMVKRNGLNALVARSGDTKDKLALQAGISTRKFLKNNDLHNFDKIEPGQVYYIETKHISANTEYHVVQPGETMQMISQHYGIRLKHLVFKNRMARNEVPVPGRLLWLQKRRPHTTPIEIRDLKQAKTAAASTNNTTPVSKQTEQAPHESGFQRFLNSFKQKKTKQPATVAKKPEPAPAKQQTVTVAELEDALKKQEEEEVITPAEPAQNSNLILYPNTKKVTPVQPEAPQQQAEEETEYLGYGNNEPATTAGTPIHTGEEIKELPANVTSEKPNPVSAETTGSINSAVRSTRHVVKQGETLYSISKMYAVAVSDITTWNNLGDQPLKMGQELLIAEPQSAPALKQETSVVTEQDAPFGSQMIHTVAAGETLYQISKKYNVTLDELKKWNNLPDNAIKLGQELRVKAPVSEDESPILEETTPVKAPETSTANSATVYHTVGTGESMYQISRKYGVTIKDIMDWNKKSDFNVKPGEKLLIRKK